MFLRQPSFAQWEKEIAALQKSPAPQGGIVFTGSSTIRMWKTLQSDLAPLPVVNRGFGGSQTFEVVHFFPRIVEPLRPRQVVLFVGTNDIHAKKSPRVVATAFMDFSLQLRWRCPGARFSYIEMTSSPSRWSEREAVVETNAVIRKLCDRNGFDFIPVREKLLDEKGEPRPELFVSDRLHLSADGYKILASAVKPFLR
jgi:lysophospholipase L1-like esterase